MNCDDVAKYRVQIKYKEKESATGVIVKLDEFPNHFFVFTAKHTFGNDKIEKNRVEILHDDIEEKIIFDSYIALEMDIVVLVCKNSNFSNIIEIEPIKIADTKNDFKECLFTGYPKNVDGHYCEKCDYHEEVKDNLYRIEPRKDTDSYSSKGLTNSKGYSGSGLFIKSESNYELVGIIKEHESNKSAFHYIALAPLKEEISQKMSFLHDDISIPKNLIDEIKNDNVVLFVGNEFSANFGFASNKEFIEQLVNDLDEKFSFIKMGIDSGGISNDMALNFLKSEKEIIKNKIVELYSGTPTNNHFVKTLWKFTSNIVTVNYDNLLESNIENIKVISTNNSYDIPPNPNFKKLFKLHGRVEDIDNILIFEDDYKSLYSKREIKKIQNSFKDKTCLFIGFSTDEVYFDLMYDTLSCGKQSYIISITQKDKYGFEPIIIDNYQQLSKAFNEIFKEEISVAKQPHVRKISDIKVQQNKVVEEYIPKVCIYTASPLNSDIDYRDKIGSILKQFKQYSVYVYHKILNEDNLLDFYGEHEYNFIFTHTNKEKIIIEDEYFMQKSIDLDELEGMVESDNTILFLDKEIIDSPFQIYEIKDYKKIKLKPFLHKSNYFEKGKSKEYLVNTDLPELIDRKNLNNFVGRVTDLETIIRKILTVKEENKILTIKGSGGIGKTTIISKAVIEMADRGKFKEGIKFVQCEFIKDYDDFENKITYAFDMNNAINFEQQLKEQELDEDRLIILDNVETLLHIEDTQKIKNLIRIISDYATIVITSRELLNERDYEDIYELQKMTTDEAEELFLKLSKITNYNKKLLRVEILENLLDNNPLAIKIITKNLLKGKSLKSLKEELEESFFDITSEDIEVIFDKESDLNIERTKSLFQSINYSYQKLTDKEKLALEILSLFPDGLRIENLKNFYNQKISNDKKNKKTIEHKIHNFSDREIKSLEDKSLVIINNGFIMLQSIIGRFAKFKFKYRGENEKKYFYKRAYAYNRHLIKIIRDGNFKKSNKVQLFDHNKNNFINSIDYIENENNVLIYLNRMISEFAMNGSPNKKLISKLKKIEINFLDDIESFNSFKSMVINLKYFYGDFSNMFEELKEAFPLEQIGEKEEQDYLNNLVTIYRLEGYVYETVQLEIKNTEWIDISSCLMLGEYNFAKVLNKGIDIFIYERFFNFEFELNMNTLDISKLNIYIKHLYKTQFLERTQSMYTLLKADATKVDLKDIKKLVKVNPFTDGLKSLMFAMKSENDNAKPLYEDAIKKLYHIKYYHVEAILIYSRYLKDREDIDYDKWFSDGKALAKKHHYRYLLHQFICLDSGVYTDYDENNYPLPEPLDYSGMIKKYRLKI